MPRSPLSLCLLVGLFVVAALSAPEVVAAPATGAASQPAAESAPVDAPVEATASTVRFRNDGPGVTVRVEGGPWHALDRGEAWDVPAAAGTTVLRYEVAHGYDWQYGGEIALDNAAARLCVLIPPLGHLQLTNRSDEPRDIVWAGRALGRLGRDETRLFGPLEVGEHELVATGARSRVASAERIALRPGGRAERVLDAVPFGLVVRNPAAEPVRVLVDQRDHGRLEPGAEATLLGLAPGEHLVVLRGLRTGRDLRGEATLREDGRNEQATAAVAVVVVNGSGETLRLPPALGGLHDGPIAPGADVRMVVPGRSLRIRLVGDESGLSYHYDVRPDAGREQRWEIERPVGIVALQNATGEPAELQIDRAPAIRMEAGKRLRVRQVPAGRVRVVVHTLESKQTFERVIRLESGQEVAWRVRAGAATLVIDNEHAEPVEISIDGTPRGRIAAGGSFRVADVPPGLHDLLSQTLYSKRREAVRARVVDGRKVHVALRPPAASVVVRNPGDRPVQVSVDGALVGEVGAGREKAFPVPSGRRVIRAVDDAGRVAQYAGNVAPGQSLPLPEPALPERVLEIQNAGTDAVQVRIDERGDWSALAAGAVLRVDRLAVGEHLVEAKGPKGEQRRRVMLRDDAPPYRVEIGN